VNSINAQIDRWIFREYAPLARSLSLYRMVYALLLMIFAIPYSSAVASLPPSFFAPPLGPGMLFHSFPPVWFFWGLDYLIELAAVCLFFGYRTRTAALTLVALLLLLNTFRYSVGKIDHEILIILTPLCLAFSDWGVRHSADARRIHPRPASPAWPLSLLWFMIALCMLSACISKAKSGWLDPHIEACRGQLLLNYVGALRPSTLGNQMAAISSPLFWKFLDYSTVCIEGAFVLAMFRLPAIRLVAASAAIFHASISFSMNIFFVSNLIAYLTLLDFRLFLRYRWARTLLRGFDRQARRIRFIPLAIVIALLTLLYVLAGEPNWSSNVVLLTSASFVTLAVGIWGVYRQALCYGVWLLTPRAPASRPQ
jgi:uncharacterized membrane protein YphA (DoxX/SURF4 family)